MNQKRIDRKRNPKKFKHINFSTLHPFDVPIEMNENFCVAICCASSIDSNTNTHIHMTSTSNREKCTTQMRRSGEEKIVDDDDDGEKTFQFRFESERTVRANHSRYTQCCSWCE